MFQEDPDSVNEDPATARVQTAATNYDFDFTHGVQDFFRERAELYADPVTQGDPETQLMVEINTDLEKDLRQLGIESEIGKVKSEDVACALADVAYVMGANNPNVMTDEDSGIDRSRYQRARSVFMKAGEKLWPSVKGTDTEFGISRVRLSTHEGDFISARTAGERLSRIGEFEGSNPPSRELVSRRIDTALAFAQEGVGMHSWNLLTQNRDGELAKGGRITVEDKKKIGSIMRELYVIEKYKDSQK